MLLPSTLTLIGLLIYSTVVATLAGTRIAPVGGLRCSLLERWQDLFRAKDADSIRAIQDGLECCGFSSVRDMAYPFPNSSNGGAKACAQTYGRTESCIDGWRWAERMCAGMMVGVAAGVFVWMVGLFLLLMRREKYANLV